MDGIHGLQALTQFLPVPESIIKIFSTFLHFFVLQKNRNSEAKHLKYSLWCNSTRNYDVEVAWCVHIFMVSSDLDVAGAVPKISWKTTCLCFIGTEARV